MISRKDLEKMMPLVERSREDKARDKMRGQKEGSKYERAADRAPAPCCITATARRGVAVKQSQLAVVPL